MIFENKKRCRGHHGPHRLATAARHRLAARRRRRLVAARHQRHAHKQKRARAHTEREVQAVAPGREVQAATPGREVQATEPSQAELGKRSRPPRREAVQTAEPSWGRCPGRRARKGSRTPRRERRCRPSRASLCAATAPHPAAAPHCR
jgi:hypothetical protein